jgi:hypothetical protein
VTANEGTCPGVPAVKGVARLWDMVLWNADNYALAIIEWYIRDLCKWN